MSEKIDILEELSQKVHALAAAFHQDVQAVVEQSTVFQAVTTAITESMAAIRRDVAEGEASRNWVVEDLAQALADLDRSFRELNDNLTLVLQRQNRTADLETAALQKLNQYLDEYL